MRINPNSPLWSIYLYLLIHGGDPAPDEVNAKLFEKVLTAGILAHVASTVRDPQAKEILQKEAFRQFESSFLEKEIENESYR